jgi:hypothetical protein
MSGETEVRPKDAMTPPWKAYERQNWLKGRRIEGIVGGTLSLTEPP